LDVYVAGANGERIGGSAAAPFPRGFSLETNSAPYLDLGSTRGFFFRPILAPIVR
jgi:hypothetical protein